MKLFAAIAAAALAQCSPVRADLATYFGALHGTVAGQTVAAAVEVQLDREPATGATVKARARLASDPGPFPVSPDWSRWHAARIEGKPFRALVDIENLKGKLAVDWTASNLTVAAEGTAGGFAIALPPQRLAMTSKAAGPTNPPAEPADPLAGVLTRVYKAGSEVGFSANVPSSWPRKSDKGKTVNAIILCNGRKFDFVLVDGDHTKAVARQDLEQAHQLCSDEGIIVMDDISDAPGECALIDVWQAFMLAHKDDYLFEHRMAGKGVAWATRYLGIEEVEDEKDE
jgi:hypothetical protein